LRIGLTPSIPETDGTLLKSSIAPPYPVENEEGELTISRQGIDHEERASCISSFTAIAYVFPEVLLRDSWRRWLARRYNIPFTIP